MVLPSLRVWLPDITNPIQSRKFLTGDWPNLRNPSYTRLPGESRSHHIYNQHQTLQRLCPCVWRLLGHLHQQAAVCRQPWILPWMDQALDRTLKPGKSACDILLHLPTLKTDAWRWLLLSDTSTILVWPANCVLCLSLMPDTPDSAQLMNTSSYSMHLSSYFYSFKGFILVFCFKFFPHLLYFIKIPLNHHLLEKGSLPGFPVFSDSFFINREQEKFPINPGQHLYIVYMINLLFYINKIYLLTTYNITINN